MSNITKPVCVLAGPVSTRSGYGEHARGIAKSLIEWDKFDLKIFPIPWGTTPTNALDRPDPLHAEIKRRILTQPLQTRPEVEIQVTLPNEFQKQARFSIGVTAGIETTLPRPDWIEGLNRMDFNIVPSRFAKEVLERAEFIKRYPGGRQELLKLNKPIDVIFEGIDTKIFRQTEEPSTDLDRTLEAIPETFCFLMVGQWTQGHIGGDRKDIAMLIRVFCETFRGKPNKPALILKTCGTSFSHEDRMETLAKINAIRQGIGCNDLPNVYLIHSDLSSAEMNRLYNHPKVKAHVSFTHGEGFGRPLLEATLSGKPLLASGWSGQLDFLPPDLANLLPGEVRQVHPSAVNPWILKESAWFVVDYRIAAQKLENVFNKYADYLPKAELLRRQNAERFTQENEKRLLIETLEKRLPQF